MIRGKNLHHADNLYNVVLATKIVLYAPSFITGILITFLTHYVFGINYAPEIEGTLEAIQRLFLEICPPKGTKRGGRRKATNVHPKVIKLIEALEVYSTDDRSN